MPESKPEYLVIVCANCVKLRHFKPKDSSNIYSCPVCGFEVEYCNGVITRITTSVLGRPKMEGMVRNPYGRWGKPK